LLSPKLLTSPPFAFMITKTTNWVKLFEVPKWLNKELTILTSMWRQASARPS
jgi:hypothetical protein